jgi:hypothetical protein
VNYILTGPIILPVQQKSLTKWIVQQRRSSRDGDACYHPIRRAICLGPSLLLRMGRYVTPLILGLLVLCGENSLIVHFLTTHFVCQSFSTQSQVLDHVGLSPGPTGRPNRSRRSRIKCTPGALSPPDGSLAHPTRSISSNGNVSSPFGLLEELFGNDPWRLFLSAILLNRTSRVQVDTIMFDFLAEWPSAEAAAGADAAKMCVVVRALGIRFRRAAGIIRFSKEYLALLEHKMDTCGSTGAGACKVDSGIDREAACNLTRDDVMNLYYCGDYAYAAYKLFIQRDYSIDPTDHALKAYAEYQRGFRSASKTRSGPKLKLLL